jgi:hypothetical protein
MQSMTTLKLCGAGLIAVALAVSTHALAEPAPVTPEMQRALAKAAQGPDELRWYVHRTRTIYALDYYKVAALYEPRKAASIDAPTPVAKASQD